MATEKTESTKTETAKIKMVDLYVPREHAKQPDRLISVNGERYYIKLGSTVKVPWYVKAAYEDSIAMKNQAMEFEAQLEERTNNIR
jgi:hypothetical protein